jgi:hypothetical protein
MSWSMLSRKASIFFFPHLDFMTYVGPEIDNNLPQYIK